MGSQSPNDNDDENTETMRTPLLTQHVFQSLIERRIAEAEARGLFHELPGTGKPLSLDDDTNVPEEDRIAYRVLKNAGFAPPWIELQKDIYQAQADLTTWIASINHRWAMLSDEERQHVRTEYQRRLGELNTQIKHYNLIVPQTIGQMPILKVHDEVAQLDCA